MLKTLVVILLSTGALALDINDTMSMKVYDVMKNNQITVNRGYSDGLNKNDHLRINNSQGYRARAIVIFTRENYSVLQLYRVIDNDSISRDDRYTLTSMKLSLIAPHMRRYLKKDFRNQFRAIRPGSSMKAYSVDNDLPKKSKASEIKKAIE